MSNKLRLSILLVLVVIFLLISFNFVLYSATLANTQQIINLRDRYQNIFYGVIRVFQKEKQPILFNPIYTFTVREWNGSYYYTFTGTFVKSDLENALIYIKAENGKLYPFRVSKKFIEQQTEFKLNNLGYSPITDSVNIDDLPLSESNHIKITWDDDRTLSKILSDYSKSKNTPLNEDSKLFFNITKRK